MSEPVATHPVQTPRHPHASSRVSTKVTLRAYEVYSHVFRPQPEMVEGGCRGGFSAGELIAFLYAHTFPQNEWRARVDEAMEGMKHL